MLDIQGSHLGTSGLCECYELCFCSSSVSADRQSQHMQALAALHGGSFDSMDGLDSLHRSYQSAFAGGKRTSLAVCTVAAANLRPSYLESDYSI